MLIEGDFGSPTNTRSVCGTNYGIIDDDTSLAAQVINHGVIIGDVVTTGLGCEVENAGTIYGKVALGSGVEYFTGRGTGTVTEGVLGGFGDNVLLGASLSDGLNGGNDVITGGRGNDRMRGNDGSDTFFFGHSTDNDAILDFEDDTDLIDLSALEVYELSDLTVTNGVGLQSVIDLTSMGGDGTITVEGMGALEWSAANFEFADWPLF